LARRKREELQKRKSRLRSEEARAVRKETLREGWACGAAARRKSETVLATKVKYFSCSELSGLDLGVTLTMSWSDHCLLFALAICKDCL
jgi:hypothetical protein